MSQDGLGRWRLPGAASVPDAAVTDSPWFSDRALRLRQLSIERSGPRRALEVVGKSTAIVDLLGKIEKVARYREPVLITGESGVGKEGVGEAIHLFGHPSESPFVSVNCPQFQEDNLTVSELFGHVRGSFTGAIHDRRGAFEEADGGLIFLDEVGDLHPSAQAILLRVLATGEFRPLGMVRPRTVQTRVVSATNKPLNELAMGGKFRYDLFFRLRHFHLAVPSLRERGDDWCLILEHSLERLAQRYGVRKQFSAAALRVLRQYSWPGNARQVIAVVSTGYAMADDTTIELDDFITLLERPDHEPREGRSLFDRVARDGEDFWTVVHQAFLDRVLNREQVRTLITQGLLAAGGSYHRMLDVLHVPTSDYQRMMAFLRHHDLKPKTSANADHQP